MADDPQPARTRSGSATGPPSATEARPASPWARVLFILLCTTVLTACCVCSGGLWYFRPQFHEDPAQVETLTRELISIAIPPVFEPRGTIDWNIAFAVRMRGAYYEIPPDDGLLMLLQVDSRFAEEPDIREHVRQTLREKGGGGAPLIIDDERTENWEVEIDGQPTVFRFQNGRDPTTSIEYHLVEGVVSGRRGPVLIAFRIKESAWNRDQVEAILESIRATD